MPSSWHKRNREFTRRRSGEPRGSGAVYFRRVSRLRRKNARNWWKPRPRDRGPAKTWTEQHQGGRHGLTVTRVAIMLAVVIIVVMIIKG